MVAMAVAAIVAAAIAAKAQSDAAKANRDSNQAAINSQENENFLQRVMADRLLRLQLSPRTDALGNRTEFIPGEGFVTTLTPELQTIANASQQQALFDLTEGAALRNEALVNQAALRRDDARTAAGLQDIFTQRLQQGGIGENELFELLLSSGQAAANEETDRQLQQVLRQNLRAGGSTESGAKLLAEFANAGAARRQDAAVDARLQALSGADNINFGRLGNVSNLLNQFIARANNAAGVPFQPEQFSTQANALLEAFQNNVGTAGNQAASLAGGPGGRPLFETQPDFGVANAIGSSGDALAGLLEFFSQQEQQNQTGATADRRVGNQIFVPPGSTGR